MTRKDIPYVVFILACMVVCFFAGRASKPAQAVAAPVASVIVVPMPSAVPSADPETIAFIKRWEEEHGNDVPPPVVVPAAPSAKPAASGVVSKPVVVAPVSHSVQPEKIELADDPIAIENPYKVKPVASNRPGF